VPIDEKENEELRNRCFELINQGLYLADTVGKLEADSNQHQTPNNNRSTISYTTKAGSNSGYPENYNSGTHNSSKVVLSRKRTSDLSKIIETS